MQKSLKNMVHIGCFILMQLLTPHIARSPESPPPFPWRFVKVAELETNNPDAAVGDFGSVVVDGHGTVSLLNRITNRHPFKWINQFDITGKWKGAISRRGDGPGEFKSAELLSAANNGDILIYGESSGLRLVHLSSQGRYISSFQIPRAQYSSGAFADTNRYWFISTHPSRSGLYDPWIQEMSLFDDKGEILWSLTYETITPFILIPDERNPLQAYHFPHPAQKGAIWTFDDRGTLWIITPVTRP